MFSAAVLLSLVLLQTESPNEKDQTKRWMDFYAKTAGEYKIVRQGDVDVPLKFEALSIFQYTNPKRERGQHGAVFVWTYDGRPEAVGTIWSIRNRLDATKRRTAHEFHSLSLSPLQSEHPQIERLGNKGTMPQWRPVEAGIKLFDFSNPPSRASNSKSVRLVQMRNLVRGFDAVSIDKEGAEDPLRLLPQPLFRYESKSAGVVDGGLFAMVSGTDPELLLMIELREADGTMKWQFAACRFTGRVLRLRSNQKTVWQCDKAQLWKGDRTYFFCVGVSQHDAELPAESDE